MITLEEAIKHCEEVAYQNEILMKRYDNASGYNRSHNEKIRTDGAKGCEQLISLYRQLADWLRELKAYKELSTYNRPNKCSECKFEDSEYYCDDCIWNSVDKFKLKEVKADGNSD